MEIEKPKLFYKYMSASTAKKVLANRSLRWSSPLIFNDPFDVYRHMASNISLADIRSAVKRKVIDVIFSDSPINDTYRNSFGVLAELARSLSASERQAIIKKIEEIEIDAGHSALEEIKNMWHEMLPAMRILCLSTVNNSTSMWHHYADKYTGVVLGFTSSAGTDGPWRMAAPVRYSDEPPLSATADGWAGFTVLNPGLGAEKLYDVSVYHKDMSWQNEKEWRIVDHSFAGDTALFSDRVFHRADLVELYLGTGTETYDKDELLEIAKDYQGISIFQAVNGSSGFKFMEV